MEPVDTRKLTPEIQNYLRQRAIDLRSQGETFGQQSPEAVGDWLMQDYPQIAAQAKQEKAEIHWGDEAGLATQEIGGKGFAPRGQTPVLQTKRHRGRVNYIATVSAQGTVRFKLYPGKFERGVMIEFLRRLVGGSQRTPNAQSPSSGKTGL
jgi:hypothetical protein